MHWVVAPLPGPAVPLSLVFGLLARVRTAPKGSKVVVWCPDWSALDELLRGRRQGIQGGMGAYTCVCIGATIMTTSFLCNVLLGVWLSLWLLPVFEHSH